MNPRVLQVQESPTIRVADRVRELERRGEGVIKLQTGDPDFATPDFLIEAAYEAMRSGYTHYAASRGLPELRQAIADKLRQENGVSYDPETEVLVTHGASYGIFAALQAFLEPADEVVMVAPHWMTYETAVILAGGRPVQVQTDPRRRFAFDPDRLDAAITPRTRLIILNTPGNPVGQVLTSEELEAVRELVDRYGLYVLADEVYERLVYDGAQHISFAALPGMKDRTITINSFSKTYAMTGWRVGYMGAPRALVDQILKVAQCAGTNVPPFSQRAALAALRDPRAVAFVEEMKQAYARRRRRVLETVQRMEGVGAIEPAGAFYVMLDVSRYFPGSFEFAGRLLDQVRVGVVPGVSFGTCAEGWVRISFAVDEETLVGGLRRIDAFLHPATG